MKRKVCHFLATGIEFRYNAIALCNRVSHSGGGDIVVEFYDENNENFNFDVKSYIKKRNEVIQQNQTDSLYPKCVGCMELSVLQDFRVSDLKISDIVLHHWTKCNSNCVYCYTNNDKNYFNTRKNYEFLPILKKLIKHNLLQYGGTVNWAGGEISCLEEFESILKILDDYDYFSIFNSSGIKFEESIASHLSNEKGLLIVSVDSGTIETHRKIKQVNSYELVWKNIDRYLSFSTNKHSVSLKYIILEHINDNEDEILKFLKKAKDVGVKQVIFDIDVYYLNQNRNNLDKRLVDLFYYALQMCMEFDLLFFIYPNAVSIFSESIYSDKNMLSYVFGDSKYEKVSKYIPLYSIDKRGNLIKYFSISQAAFLNKVEYRKILKICNLNKKNRTVFFRGKTYIYCRDIDENSLTDKNKIIDILSRKSKLSDLLSVFFS